jgi:hypothetical protein
MRYKIKFHVYSPSKSYKNVVKIFLKQVLTHSIFLNVLVFIILMLPKLTAYI